MMKTIANITEYIRASVDKLDGSFSVGDGCAFADTIDSALRAEKEISDRICDKCANGVDHAECVRLRAELEKVRAERDQWRQQALEEDGRANAIASGERLQ